MAASGLTTTFDQLAAEPNLNLVEELNVIGGSAATGLESLRSMTAIKTLVIRGTDLRELPPFFLEAASGLRVLDLSGNQIQRVHDAAFSGLNHLVAIDLSNNLLRRRVIVPGVAVNITGNPIENENENEKQTEDENENKNEKQTEDENRTSAPRRSTIKLVIEALTISIVTVIIIVGIIVGIVCLHECKPGKEKLQLNELNEKKVKKENEDRRKQQPNDLNRTLINDLKRPEIQLNVDELEKRETRIKELSARLVHEAQNYDAALSTLNDLKAKWMRNCKQSVDRERRLETLLIAGQFKDALQALFDWIEKAKESIADDRVFGDRDTVLHLIEAHRLFAEELKSRSKNLNQVREFCNELVQAAGGDQKQIDNIPGQLDDLENRWEEINKLADARGLQLQDALEHSKRLEESLTELFARLKEVNNRLRFSEQMPDDEETTRRQIAEHVKFINEEEQNKQRSISLAKETLAKCHPDAVPVINHWTATIETLWSDVTAHANQRQAKLNEHLDRLEEMFKLLDELHGWLVESEASLVKRDSDVMPEEIETLERLIDDHERFIQTMSGKQKDIEKIARMFAVKKVPGMSSSNQSMKGNASATRISDLKRGNSKAKDLIDQWHSIWLLSTEHKRRLKDQLEHCREKMKTFEFDEWRNRFTNWLKSDKARALDFFKKMDEDNDGRLTREQFIEGFLKSKFTTSQMELEHVTPIFDRNHDGIIDQKEFMDTLRPERDLSTTDNEIIQNEIHCKFFEFFEFFEFRNLSFEI